MFHRQGAAEHLHSLLLLRKSLLNILHSITQTTCTPQCDMKRVVFFLIFLNVILGPITGHGVLV